MPHLMVNLEDIADCRKSIEILRRRIRRAAGGDAEPARNVASQHREVRGGSDVASMPMPQKLKRLQSRGMWKHLVRIAQAVDQPLSLPELDEHLDLPKNKMRSLKANMAKLENRFDLKFLKVDAEAGADAAGNPRYIMVPRVRTHILRLTKSE